METVADQASTVDRHLRAWSSAGGGGLLTIALLLLLAGCTTATARRPSTLSDLLLALDASEKMGGDPRCRDRSVATTEVIVPVELASQGVSGRWTERWTVDRCGVLVPYVVKFDRAPDGDLDVSMQRETSDVATIPGATIADRVLQRDTLAFLAQRDLLEAGPEARCRTRKIVATEVVTPLEDGQVEGDRPVAGKWSELWTLDRCGMSIGYLIRFNTTPNGTSFVAERQR